MTKGQRDLRVDLVMESCFYRFLGDDIESDGSIGLLAAHKEER